MLTSTAVSPCKVQAGVLFTDEFLHQGVCSSAHWNTALWLQRCRHQVGHAGDGEGLVIEAVVNCCLTGSHCYVYREQGVNVSQGLTPPQSPHPGATSFSTLHSAVSPTSTTWLSDGVRLSWVRAGKKSQEPQNCIFVPSLTFSF